MTTATRHRRKGTRPLGRRTVYHHHPHYRLERFRKFALPRVHAATAEACKLFLFALRIFLRVYQAASAEFRSGDLTTEFPDSCFLPRGPFVEPRGGVDPFSRTLEMPEED